jgi:hypothetical protein
MDDETYLPEHESIGAIKDRIELTDVASSDELLLELLVRCYPTKSGQNS